VADLERYLDLICGDVPFCSDEVRVELSHHIEQSAAKLEAEGHAPEEALAVAIREFGDPAEIAAGLAEAHRRGGGAMFRRMIAPALIAVGVCLGALTVGALLQALKQYAEGFIFGRTHGMPPLLPMVDWLILVGVFLAVRLCAARGGTRRECTVVGLAPFIVLAPLGLVLVLCLAGFALPNLVLGLGFGFGHQIESGEVLVRTILAARQLLGYALGIGCTSLAGTWLYFFAARHMRERPFWLAAEESQTQAT
jgi:hypothetical protein